MIENRVHWACLKPEFGQKLRNNIDIQRVRKDRRYKSF